MRRTIFLSMFICFILNVGISHAQTKLTVWTNKSIAPISSTMWGIFFEDINFGADGGLYAELIKNRSFNFPEPLEGWTVPYKDSIRIYNQDFSNHNSRYIELCPLKSKSNYIISKGFRGIGVHAKEAYQLKIDAKGTDESEIGLKAELLDEKGQVLASGVLAGYGSDWQEKTLELISSVNCSHASLKISPLENKAVDIRFVSLFPVHTFKNRVNGMRNDLAEMLADLHPGFIRFPGGCIVEGRRLEVRYQWKKTLGDIRDRQLIVNRWNTEMKNHQTPDYYQSFGLGFYEYFQLAEDLGAEPLPIVNCGMACQYNTKELVPLDKMEPFIQDALDLIEFANGAISTKWGKIRAEMGHPKPFNLKYIGIGNEQWGQQFLDRYQLIADQVHKKYPEIKLIADAGPSPDGKRFSFLWSKLPNYQANLVDEHYYRSPEWFLSNAKRYDNYSRTGLKVFAGEYACHTQVKNTDPSSNNNWQSALAEAAFMTGLERNAAVVHMASYAPLFGRVDAWQWRPDLIWFDNLHAVATPNYYVQKMYSTHKGTKVIPVLEGKNEVAGKDSLYASASIDEPTGHVFLKIVNVANKKNQLSIQLKGVRPSSLIKITELHSDDLLAYNTLKDPNQIIPETRAVALQGTTLDLTLKSQTFILIDIPEK